MTDREYTCQITLRVRYAWWLDLYLRGVVLMCHITGLMPDEDRVAYWINRAIRIEVVR